MLDLILDSRTIDVGDSLFSGTIRATITDVFTRGSTDFMSSIESNRQTNEKALADAMPQKAE